MSEPLGSLTPAEFLRDYWQKKPLLIRQAFPGFTSPVTPDDLKALATRDDAHSRLVLEEGGDYPWQLHHGPFLPEELGKLPPNKWTVLVQEVDKFVPEIAALRDHFRFIPSWRIDDVMISYAPADGGVGAHIDQYDVFLLQGMGRRRWRIGNAPVEDDSLVENLDVSVLAHFEWTDEYTLEPGDMLYLPPRIAHEGVALDDCLTISVGFRAPSHADLVAGFLENALQTIPDDRFYTDPGLTPPAHPGEIDDAALDQVRGVLHDVLTDDTALREWFGKFMTESRRGFDEADGVDVDAAELEEAIEKGGSLLHAPGARFAFTRLPDGEAMLFAGGQAYRLEKPLAFAAPLFADHRRLDADTLRRTPRLARLCRPRRRPRRRWPPDAGVRLMPLPLPPSRIEKWERLGRRHEGHYRVFDLYKDRVRAPHTGTEHDFVLIEARDWVNVIPVTPGGEIVFVRQYRHGTDAVSLEIPGGIIDAGDASPEAAARREMREETGYDTENVIRLGSVATNPALFNNTCYTCLAQGVTPTEAVAFDETEDLEVVLVDPGDVPGLIGRGEVSHALVVGAFYLYHVWQMQNRLRTT